MPDARQVRGAAQEALRRSAAELGGISRLSFVFFLIFSFLIFFFIILFIIFIFFFRKLRKPHLEQSIFFHVRKL